MADERKLEIIRILHKNVNIDNWLDWERSFQEEFNLNNQKVDIKSKFTEKI
jgi:hypothetical protein